MRFLGFLNQRNAARKSAAKTAKDSGRSSYLINDSSPFAITEAFRSLKMAISVSMAKENDGLGQSFLCTSSYPAEGKTTVAANTALMLAQSNVKVVLVDTDLRAGRISKYFKIPQTPGLSDYLSGHASLSDVLVQTSLNPNLYVICRGTHTARPYELLADHVFADLNEKLKKDFSYVLYDSPPVGLVSDALAVAPVADGTFLVTRYEHSYQSEIRSTVEALRFVKANILGIVVNDFRPDRLAKKSSHYTQYYYSYYSGDKQEKNNPAERADEKKATLK
ncbi:MAG: CpsD/CapB family tyrosine-protein kinase [Candidatus Borkfalkiaceae bacterium]|nr:CpsD/CapB family tyrosine-protein kinase [Clostridia bacterium]MDY6222541.1 CpsD/CapB family tyrosine-protein kinase [Christensenellaceae bacterium]